MTADVWIPERTASGDRDLLPRDATVHELPQHGDLPEQLGHGDILVVDYQPARALEAISRLESLRVVQTLSAGVDGLVEHMPPGVMLCDAASVHDISVAEWVLMSILAQRHNLVEHVEGQRIARWQRARVGSGGDDLEGATVLIVGHGSIGRALEARLAPFDVRILRIARVRRDGVGSMADLAELLPQADVVVILLPLTPATRGVVDAGFLAAMQPGALLVNAARGPIVDTKALLAALLKGRLRAALDVTDPEPLPDGHPLWTAPGILITPHVAGAVARVYRRAWRLVAAQVERYIRGEPLHNVVVDGY